MIVNAVKTGKITAGAPPITSVLDRSLASFTDRSILVVTSKIISICEGRVVKIDTKDKEELIEEESQRYIPSEKSKYNISLTIAHDILVPTAGIDESNGNGYYVLWPRDPYASAKKIRDYLTNRFAVKDVGVLISDSHTTALRWGTTGISLAHAGFDALKNYIDAPDIFGRPLHVTKANIADGLAAAAVTVMGEGNEQTPLCVISDIPFVRFDQNAPTKEDIKNLHIDPSDDLYLPLIESAAWKMGKG